MFYSLKYKSRIKPQFSYLIFKVKDIKWLIRIVYLIEPYSDYKLLLLFDLYLIKFLNLEVDPKNRVSCVSKTIPGALFQRLR